MATLKDDVKAFIVQALACFDTPQQVAEQVKQEFGLDITRMQASSYDPTKAMGRNLGAKWTAVFEATREKFLADTSSIPIASQTYRLRTLDRMLQRVEKQGNVVVAAQLIEQAAKEIGGAFTNKRELSGPGGSPVIGAVTVEYVRVAKNPDR